MKKLLLIIGIIVIVLFSAFTNPKRDDKKKENKKTETVEKAVIKIDKDSERFKQDMQESVLEFIDDIKANPDTCYIPFKK